MSNRFIFLNKDFVPEEKARLHVSDLAVQRGYGIFDFLRVANNQPLFLEQHLKRFYNSANEMRLPVSFTEAELKEVIYTLIQKNDLPSSGIRITVTGGYSPDGYMIAEPNLIITQSLLQLPAVNTFEKGLKIITHNYQRQLPQVKTIDYLMAIWLQPLIKLKGADDVLYHHDGMVSECPRANFFIVTNDETIITPANNILKGITRQQLLELPDFTIIEKDISIEDINKASEAFITSTTKAVLPVIQVDDFIIGGGKPGSVTKRLLAALTTVHEKVMVHQL